MKTTIYLENASQAAIIAFEILGQISDGHWENSRPSYHWTWIWEVEYNIDELNGLYYTGHQHRKYGVKNFAKKAINEWLFGNRMKRMGRLAKVYPEMEKHLDNRYIGYAAEHLPETKKMEYEDYMKSIVDCSFMSEYLEKANITKEIYDAFYAVEYSEKEFWKDIASIQAALNTFEES